MKVSAPNLSPILRSDAQGRLLAALFAHPEQSFTLTELAALAGISAPTIMREIDRLVAGEYLLDVRVGRARQIRANTEHALYQSLWQILMYGYGPVAVLPKLLKTIRGIDTAFIYGSWAARYLGVTGEPPRDIDVLIVGSAEYGECYAVAQEASALLGREVSIQVVSSERWEDATDGFLQTVKSRPLIELTLENS